MRDRMQRKGRGQCAWEYSGHSLYLSTLLSSSQRYHSMAQVHQGHTQMQKGYGTRLGVLEAVLPLEHASEQQ